MKLKNILAHILLENFKECNNNGEEILEKLRETFEELPAQ